MADYQLTENPPEFVSDLPRSSDLGTVIREVGVIVITDRGNRYWKAYQLIEEDDGSNLIRPAYYTENGYQNKPLTLPPNVMADLHQFAAGKIL